MAPAVWKRAMEVSGDKVEYFIDGSRSLFIYLFMFSCAFWIAEKPLTQVCARLLQWLEALGVPINMQWVVCNV